MKSPVAGVGLLLTGAVLVAVPFLWFPVGSHPLSGQERIDLCASIDERPLRALPYELMAREEIRMQDGSPAQCLLELGFHGLGDTGNVELTVTLLTQAVLNKSGSYMDTEKYWQTFIAESRASGSEVENRSGPWRNGALLRQLDGELWLLAEDRGVVIWLRAYKLERAELFAFADALVERLREVSTDD